jgi:hypothetical protein
MVRLLGAALAAGLALAACGGGMTKADGNGKPATGEKVPANAIAVGDDIYMVPMGKDDGGCEMFRVFSPTKMVAQAIHYRTADGRFVMNRAEAACKP